MSILHNILLLSTYYDPKENLSNNVRVDCTNGKRMVIIINDEKVMHDLNSYLIVFYNVSMIQRKLYFSCISLYIPYQNFHCISILWTISYVTEQGYEAPQVSLHPVEYFEEPIILWWQEKCEWRMRSVSIVILMLIQSCFYASKDLPTWLGHRYFPFH